MIILGNILNSSDMLVATSKGISLVNSKALYAKLKQCNSNTLSSVAFKDRVSQRVKSNSVLNKTGLISKRYGTPLLIKNANTNASPIGPCVIKVYIYCKPFILGIPCNLERNMVK